MPVMTLGFLDIATKMPPGSRLFLEGVSWEEYEGVLSSIEKNSRIRVSYDQGRMQLMTLSYRHENFKGFFGILIFMMSRAMKFDYSSAGSTTFKHLESHQGAEPDDCFYIANLPRVAGKDDLDLEVDPPPDLVVEIDISKPSLNKLPIYAGMRVKEVWKYDGECVTILRLLREEYQESRQSGVLPILSSAKLTEFIEIGKNFGLKAMADAFHPWIEEQSKTQQ